MYIFIYIYIYIYKYVIHTHIYIYIHIHNIHDIHGFTHLRVGHQAVLLSAAFDHRLGLIDVRQPKQAALAALLRSKKSRGAAAMYIIYIYMYIRYYAMIYSSIFMIFIALYIYIYITYIYTHYLMYIIVIIEHSMGQCRYYSRLNPIYGIRYI